MASLTAGLSSLSINSPILCTPKMAAGTKGQPVDIRTNSIKMSLKPNIPFFKYDIRMSEVYPGKDGVKYKEITKQTKDDYTEQDRKEKTVKIYKFMAEKKLIPPISELIYDRAAVLFTTKDLKYKEQITLATGEVTTGQTFKIMMSELAPLNLNVGEDCKGVEVTIKKVTENFQCSSNDVAKAASARHDEQDKGILEVLNLLTSQVAFFETDRFITYGTNSPYLLDPETANFYNLPDLKESKYLGVGASKSVKVLEGNLVNGKPSPSAVVTTDVKKGAFHLDCEPAHKKFSNILDVQDFGTVCRLLTNPSSKRKVEKQVKGLMFRTKYGKKKREFRCTGLGRSAKDITFVDSNGKKQSLPQYFKSTYGLTLVYVDLPVLVATGSKGECYYPAELCEVAPNQRVGQQQQTPAQVQVQVKACAIAPTNRLQQTDAMNTALKLAPNSRNDYFSKSGVELAKEPVMVQGRIMPPVTVRTGKGPIASMNKWDAGKFIVPAKVTNWAMYGVFPQKEAQSSVLKKFLNAICDTGKEMGMTINQPKIVDLIGADPDDIENIFKKSKADGVNFLFFVSSDMVAMHDWIKKCELTYQILTQEVRFSKARDGKRDTMRNIIAKTNMKNGGLNHVSQDAENLLEKNFLIMGIEFSHPPPENMDRVHSSMPSVMGWAANCTAEKQQFVGDYRFMLCRQADMGGNSLKDVMKDVVMRYRRSRGKGGALGPAPSHVILYRNGASEGQYKDVLEKELTQMEEAYHELSSGNWRPETVVVAVSKEHTHRLFKKTPGTGRPAEQNITPGTLVDKGIVNPTLNEFFLCAHSAFQGTAKVPKYTLLRNGKDDKAFSMDQIQGITHALTFSHGIITATISLPCPLKVAGECAKRGANNWKQEMGDSSTSGGSTRNIEECNQKLTYTGKRLSNVRYNS